MPKVTAYQCKFTGKMFAQTERKKYFTHLKKMRKKIHEKNRISRAKREFDEWSRNARNTLSNITDIEKFFIDNSQYIAYAMAPTVPQKYRDSSLEVIVHNLRFKVVYGKFFSNAHGAPIGEPRNFHRLPTTPLFYPGFGGRMEMEVFGNYTLLQDGMECMGAYRGSGGGYVGKGGLHYLGYDFVFWAQDWPALYDEYERDLLYKKLMGK